MFTTSACALASSACSSLIWFCSWHIAPAHPYTGSRILAFASYTMLLTASALCDS
ncbi:hypothetical protein LINPERHAP2_LOCUS31138, partial [Linum perenne]